LLADELLTRSALGADARLSGGVLGNVIEDLRWRGVLLMPEAPEPGLRGPKTRYQLNADHGRVLVIGFGHDRLGVAVTDLTAEIVDGCDYVDAEPSPGLVEHDPTGSLERAVKHASALLDQTHNHVRLVGVGVSLPAPLMRSRRPDDAGHLYAGFMDAWQARDLTAELRRLLELPDDCPVVLENDANLTALREHRRGAARGATHALVVKWGAAVGAGLIIDGEVYEGPRGLAGEIGHIKASTWLGDPNPDETLPLFNIPEIERTCPRCDQPCLEALISASGLVKHLAYTAKKQKRAARFRTITDVIGEALHGDTEAREALYQAGHLLGHKLGPIVSALNLQRIVLDCFADESAFDLVVDGLRDGLKHRMTPAAFQQVRVRVATTKQKSAILGAAELVLDKHLASWVGRLPVRPPEPENGAQSRTQARRSRA
jgi:predicted NBD/HSP70 family sugar kinase